MAGNRTSFTKRQKEQARQQKQRDKAERKQQRAIEKANQPSSGPEYGTNEVFDDGDRSQHHNSAPFDSSTRESQ